MATRKTRAKKPASPKLIRTLSLTDEDATALDRLAQDAGDFLGWAASSSAVIRALIRHADRQAVDWQRGSLFSLMEKEIASGTTWGGNRKGRKKSS